MSLLPAWKRREQPRFRVKEKHFHGPSRPVFNLMLTNPRNLAKWPHGFVVMSFRSRESADEMKTHLEAQYG